MTCIVGFVDKNYRTCYMAGDHIGTDGYSKLNYNNQKVFKNGEFLIGYTTSFRMGQLLQYKWKAPTRNKTTKDDLEYLVNQVVPSFIKLFRDNGFLSSESEATARDSKTNTTSGAISGGQFLIGYRGRLYTVQSDFAVLEEARGYAACGCGQEYALGAISALDGLAESELIPPPGKERMELIFHAVEDNCALVKVDWDRFEVLENYNK